MLLSLYDVIWQDVQELYTYAQSCCCSSFMVGKGRYTSVMNAEMFIEIADPACMPGTLDKIKSSRQSFVYHKVIDIGSRVHSEFSR